MQAETNTTTSTTQIAFKRIPIQSLAFKEYPQPHLQSNPSKMWAVCNPMKPALKVLCYYETCPLTAICQNGFADAFIKAYTNHGDIKFTPDDIWIVIMLHFSKYVLSNFQQLRKAFVNHEDQKPLCVTTLHPDGDGQKAEKQWDGFFAAMKTAITNNTVEGVARKLSSQFSTTGRVQSVFSTAILMNTFQKYFKYYRMIGGCGIQNVEMGGTLQDWKLLKDKLHHLGSYDVDGKLTKYVSEIEPIIDQFIQTYQGNVDVKFWNNVYCTQKGMAGSGSISSVPSGWIIRFFGYYQPTWRVLVQMMDCPINIINLLTKEVKVVHLVGGFKGVSQEGRVYRPHLSFSIIERAPEKKK